MFAAISKSFRADVQMEMTPWPDVSCSVSLSVRLFGCCSVYLLFFLCVYRFACLVVCLSACFAIYVVAFAVVCLRVWLFGCLLACFFGSV